MNCSTALCHMCVWFAGTLCDSLAIVEIDIERCLADDMTLRSFQSFPGTNVNFDNEHGTEKIEMGRLYSQYFCGTGQDRA